MVSPRPEAFAQKQTTNAYADIISIDGRPYADTTMTIANMGTTLNAFDYEVAVFSNFEYGSEYLLTSGSVVKDASDEVLLRRHAKIVVRAKSTVDDAPAMIKVDAIMGR